MADDDGDDGEGSIFKFVTFWLSARVPSRSHYQKMIKANGGQLAAHEKDADVLIADHVRKRDAPEGALSYKYIEACVAAGTLVDKGPHLIDSAPVGGPRARVTRSQFTEAEDRLLYDFVHGEIAAGAVASGSGNNIYKQFATTHPRHTWQSWRHHWLTHVSLQPPPPRDAVVAAPLLAGSPAAAAAANGRRAVSAPAPAAGSNVAQPPPARRAGARVPFTNADDELLYQYVWHKMQTDPKGSDKGNVIYQELERRMPHHTFHSWRDRWIKVVQDWEAPDGRMESPFPADEAQAQAASPAQARPSPARAARAARPESSAPSSSAPARSAPKLTKAQLQVLRGLPGVANAAVAARAEKNPVPASDPPPPAPLPVPAPAVGVRKNPIRRQKTPPAPAPPPPAPPPAATAKFTPQDDRVLDAHVRGLLKAGRAATDDAVFKDLAKAQPHHTWRAWTKRWTDVVSTTEAQERLAREELAAARIAGTWRETRARRRVAEGGGGRAREARGAAHAREGTPKSPVDKGKGRAVASREAEHDGAGEDSDKPDQEEDVYSELFFHKALEAFRESEGLLEGFIPTVGDEPMRLWPLFQAVRAQNSDFDLDEVDWSEVASQLGVTVEERPQLPGELRRCFEQNLLDYAREFVKFVDFDASGLEIEGEGEGEEETGEAEQAQKDDTEELVIEEPVADTVSPPAARTPSTARKIPAPARLPPLAKQRPAASSPELDKATTVVPASSKRPYEQADFSDEVDSPTPLIKRIRRPHPRDREIAATPDAKHSVPSAPMAPPQIVLEPETQDFRYEPETQMQEDLIVSGPDSDEEEDEAVSTPVPPPRAVPAAHDESQVDVTPSQQLRSEGEEYYRASPLALKEGRRAVDAGNRRARATPRPASGVQQDEDHEEDHDLSDDGFAPPAKPVRRALPKSFAAPPNKQPANPTQRPPSSSLPPKPSAQHAPHQKQPSLFSSPVPAGLPFVSVPSRPPQQRLAPLLPVKAVAHRPSNPASTSTSTSTPPVVLSPSPDSPSTASESSRLEAELERFQSLGYRPDVIRIAMEAASLKPGLASHVMQALTESHTVPDDVRDVWTTQDDADLRAAMSVKLPELYGGAAAVETPTTTTTARPRQKQPELLRRRAAYAEVARSGYERLRAKHGADGIRLRRKYFGFKDKFDAAKTGGAKAKEPENWGVSWKTDKADDKGKGVAK